MSLPARSLFAFVAVVSFVGGAGAQDRPRAAMLPLGEMQALAAVYDTLDVGLADDVGGKALMRSAIKGMVREADPEAGEYYTEEEYKALQAGPATSAGIGAEMARHGPQMVILPLPAGPAASAGVRAGDVLLSVDDKPLQGLGVDEAAALLRGPAGSKVRLRVLHALAVQPEEVSIERQVALRREVSATRPAADVLVLQVTGFGDRMLDEVARHLDTEWRRSPYRGVVLDLRGCSGGVLKAAVGLAAIFLPADVLVTNTHGRLEAFNRPYRANAADYLRGRADPLEALPLPVRALPLVALVDGGTAAGAEIVVAALKDHGRATVVGHPTFGRGSIQVLVPLKGFGAVKFTAAHWESPLGTRVHSTGIQPDLVLPAGDAEQELSSAIDALRKRLPS